MLAAAFLKQTRLLTTPAYWAITLNGCAYSFSLILPFNKGQYGVGTTPGRRLFSVFHLTLAHFRKTQLKPRKDTQSNKAVRFSGLLWKWIIKSKSISYTWLLWPTNSMAEWSQVMAMSIARQIFVLLHRWTSFFDVI